MPGSRLIEAQIAEQLQVSRTPIREAIRQLQQEELVSADELGWLRVTTISSKEAEHLYDCRLALETLAVAHACEQVQPEQLEYLESWVLKAEAHLQQLQPVSPNQLLELDCSFHRTIAECTGNTCLLSLLDHVFGKMALLRVQTTLHNPRVLEVSTEHRRIYTAIAQRDAKAAVEAVQQHLVASKNRVVQELEILQQER